MRIFIKSLFVFGLIISASVFAYPATTDSTIVLEEDTVITDNKKMPWEEDTIEAFGVEKGEDLLEASPQQQSQPEDVQSKEIMPDVASDMTSEDMVSESESEDEYVDEDADVLTFEEISKRLMVLDERDKIFSDQIVQLEERIAKLEKDIVDKRSGDSLYSKFCAHMDRIRDRLGPKLFFITISSIVLAFLALLIYLMIPRRKVVSNVSYPKDTTAGGGNAIFVDDEADEMNKAAESKLNLARTYMEMGEVDKAKPMLIDVLSHGTDKDQEEAKGLLDKIKYGDE